MHLSMHVYIYVCNTYVMRIIRAGEQTAYSRCRRQHVYVCLYVNTYMCVYTSTHGTSLNNATYINLNRHTNKPFCKHTSNTKFAYREFIGYQRSIINVKISTKIYIYLFVYKFRRTGNQLRQARFNQPIGDFTDLPSLARNPLRETRGRKPFRPTFRKLKNSFALI
jgi:hypothetical protein